MDQGARPQEVACSSDDFAHPASVINNNFLQMEVSSRSGTGMASTKTNQSFAFWGGGKVHLGWKLDLERHIHDTASHSQPEDEFPANIETRRMKNENSPPV